MDDQEPSIRTSLAIYAVALLLLAIGFFISSIAGNQDALSIWVKRITALLALLLSAWKILDYMKNRASVKGYSTVVTGADFSPADEVPTDIAYVVPASKHGKGLMGIVEISKIDENGHQTKVSFATEFNESGDLTISANSGSIKPQDRFNIKVK